MRNKQKMEQPSEMVMGFYEFCMQHIQNLRERPKIAKILGEAYTFEQAFWIHVVGMALCTWDDDSEDEIKLSEVFRVYLTIYRNDIVKNMGTEDELLFIKILKDKYDTANKIYENEDSRRVGLHLAQLALGEEVNIIRLVLAELDILSFAPSVFPIPFRLVKDI